MRKDKVGKRVVVTGGASGIGLAIGSLFLERGDSVAGIDLKPAEGGGFPVIAADLSKPEEVAPAIHAAAERLGGIDVLVCSAGITYRGNAEATPVDAWDRVFAVNVRAAYLCAQAALPYLRERPGASIINIGSQYAIVAAPNYVAYCASKAALLHLTRAMAVDHGREGIRVNAVCPGPTDTPMMRGDLAAGGLAAEGARASVARTITGRPASTREIAAAVAFLASEECGSVIGAALVSDGGFSIY
jgi:NAD(P)-dependent dehydrogenase (short-subunit alcohol dehydrogenase family)